MCIPVASEFDPVMPIDATRWPSDVADVWRLARAHCCRAALASRSFVVVISQPAHGMEWMEHRRGEQSVTAEEAGQGKSSTLPDQTDDSHMLAAVIRLCLVDRVGVGGRKRKRP